jgi:S1-C subfamily serine protease
LEVSIIKQFPRNQSKSIKKNIQSEKWSGNGSGIIISKSGHIVTCNHVTNGAVEIEVEFILENEVKKFKAEVVQADKKNDLAILKIKDNNFNGIKEPPFKLNTVVGDVGTEVFAFGYPLALTVMGKEVKVTDGIISSKSGFEGDITTYQITAPIQGGNSGGPLFDNKGNLIGINSSGIRKDLVDNVAYSIKTNYVLNLIDMLSEPVDIPSKNSLVYLPLTEKIKQLSKYVVLVKVK